MKKFKQMKKEALICIVSILLSIISMFLVSEKGMSIAILIVILLSYYMSFRDIDKNIIFFLFNTFLIFFVSGKVIIDGIFFEAFSGFTSNIKMHSLLCIYLSHLSLYLGYKYFTKKSKLYINNEIKHIKYDNYKIVYKILVITFFLSSLAFSLSVIEKILFVNNNGYLELYTNFSTLLPNLIIRLSNLFYLSFFALINFPLKKIKYIVCLIFVILSFLTIFTGQRSHIALNLIVFLFIIIIQNKDLLKRFITKRSIICLMIFSFLFLAILQSVQSYRVNGYIAIKDFNPISLIYNQGYTSNVIAYEKLVENELDNSFYTLATVKETFRNNPIVKKIFNFPTYQGNTLEIVENQSYLSYDLSYLILQQNYLKGEGIGTSYIAEIYHDFSYLGLCIFGFVCAYLCILFNNYYKFNFFIATLMLISLKYFLFLPRWDTLYFLVAPFQSFNVLLILILFIFDDKKINSILNKIKIRRRKL